MVGGRCRGQRKGRGRGGTRQQGKARRLGLAGGGMPSLCPYSRKRAAGNASCASELVGKMEGDGGVQKQRVGRLPGLLVAGEVARAARPGRAVALLEPGRPEGDRTIAATGGLVARRAWRPVVAPPAPRVRRVPRPHVVGVHVCGREAGAVRRAGAPSGRAKRKGRSSKRAELQAEEGGGSHRGGARGRACAAAAGSAASP